VIGRAWRLVKANKAASASAAFLTLVLVAAVLAPWLAPYDPAGQDLAATREAPSWRHPLGTDSRGADVLSKVIYGARPTLVIAVCVSLSTVVIGFLLGIAAGYTGKWIDAALMRAVDVMLAFPELLLNIILVAVLGAGMTSLFLALTLSGWAGVARIARGLMLSLAGREYVLSARALGAGAAGIVFRHVIPNCASTMIVVAAMRMGTTVLAAAGLSYLGFGGSSDSNSWGVMVSAGQYEIVTAWWWPFFPATAIALTVLSFNLLADAARDLLDPRALARPVGPAAA